MPHAEIPTPVRGVNLVSPLSKMPAGTTRAALNTSSFSPDGVARLSRRLGVEKYGSNRINGVNPVRAITSLCRRANARILVKGDMILEDQFDRADTAGGAAGLGSDWTIKEMTPFDWGADARVISNTTAASATDDPQIDGNTVISPGAAKYWACMYDTSTFQQAENSGRIIEIKFRTNTVAGLAGASDSTAIGLLTNIDNVAPPTNLTTRIAGIELDDSATFTGQDYILSDDYIATRQNSSAATSQDTPVAPPRIALEPNKEYTLQMHVWRGRGTGGWYNIYIVENGVELVVVNGVDSATQPITITDFYVGFWIRHVTTDAAVVAVDSFHYYEASLDTSGSRCVVVAESDGDLAYETGDGIFRLSYGSLSSVLLTAPSVIRSERRIMGVWAPEVSGLYYFYFSDGVRYGKFSFDTKNFYQWEDTSGAGDLPGAVGSSVANIVAYYRNRILLSGNPLEPDNIYASKIADPVEWNYATSGSAAWAAATGNLGAIPDSVTCLIPFSDDLCLVAGRRTLNVINGDPNYGGALDNISTEFGVVGRFAACRDETGAVYAVAPQGFVRIAPGSGVEIISRGRLDPFFHSLDYSQEEIACVWDPIAVGVHIVRLNETATPRSWWFWDQRADAFHERRHDGVIGPSAIHFAQMGGGMMSKTMIGGVDGYVRKYVDAADDDGVAIDAYTDVGPIVSPANRRMKLSRLEAVLAAGSAMSYAVRFGQTPEDANDAAALFSGTWAGPGRCIPDLRRATGGAGIVRLSGAAQWSVERLSATIDEAGLLR